MSDTNTTTLSELLSAIQLTLQPYRASDDPAENPFSVASTTYDGPSETQSSQTALDRSRRDSGISVSSVASPTPKSAEPPIAHGRRFSDFASPLSRSSTQLHTIDTKGGTLFHHSARPITSLRREISTSVSSAPLSSSHHTIERPPSAVSLSKILRDRELRSAPLVPTVPQFSARRGCILAPNCSIEATRFQARTESGRPAWWCRYDNMVVFDGMEPGDGTDQPKIKTRSSKGLAVANLKGNEETVLVELDCAHCRDILGLRVWRYVAKVCERSVCAVCRARCKVEWHRSLGMLESRHSHPLAEPEIPIAMMISEIPQTLVATEEPLPEEAAIEDVFQNADKVAESSSKTISHPVLDDPGPGNNLRVAAEKLTS
jgi:hypothetical protein